MYTLAIEWAPILTGLLVLVFVGVSVLMILTVLIQRPAGGGLSGAFGSGAGSGQTAFGTKTGDALTIATITMFVLFLLFAIVLNFLARPGDGAPEAPAVTTPATDPAAAPAGAGETPAVDPLAPAPAGAPGEQPAAPTGEQPTAPAGEQPAGPPSGQPADPPPAPQNPPR